MTTLWNDLKEDLKPNVVLVATYTSDSIGGDADTFVCVTKSDKFDILKEKCLKFANEDLEIDTSELTVKWGIDTDGFTYADVFEGYSFKGWFGVLEFELE